MLLGDWISPPWDALRVAGLCWGMLSSIIVCFSFAIDVEDETVGEHSDCEQSWLTRRDESLSEGFSSTTSGAGTMIGI